jgi:fructose-1,6-bisphosphatase I
MDPRRALKRLSRLLLGEATELPAALLQRYPMLRDVRWRRGGLPPRVGGWCLLRREVQGITLGQTVFLSPSANFDPALLLHEFAHVRQFAEVSAFPLRYAWQSLRHGYRGNRFERDADEYAAQVLGRSLLPPEARQLVKHTATSVVTIERFIIEEERNFPDATGELSGILYDMALAAKMIANKVRSAGLADILGSAGAENVQGEIQQKLDVISNEIIVKAFDHGGRLCAMASEEEPGIIQIPEGFRTGKYVMLFDPLDGSSNIDVNVPVGTIFSVYKKITRGPRGEMEDMLQPGRRQVAAGYIIYGSSTMLVYTTGQGAHGFTLDPSIGEFLLSHPHIRIPNTGRYLSVNDAYEQDWPEHTRALMRRYRGLDGERKSLNVRYVGSLVADFHRNLLGGGVFAYPSNTKSPRGKLRLLYEANPLAFIVEQAGGLATDGVRRILDVDPTDLHQRTPLYIGSKVEVETVAEFMPPHDESPRRRREDGDA